MLNNTGGKLLIGIGDDGEILGIENDLLTLSKPTRDGAELLLINMIQNSVGINYLTNSVKISFEEITGKIICIVLVKPSTSPVFFKEGHSPEFWVRVGNSTRQLDIKAATEYIRTHWGRK